MRLLVNFIRSNLTIELLSQHILFELRVLLLRILKENIFKNLHPIPFLILFPMKHNLSIVKLLILRLIELCLHPNALMVQLAIDDVRLARVGRISVPLKSFDNGEQFTTLLTL